MMTWDDLHRGELVMSLRRLRLDIADLERRLDEHTYRDPALVAGASRRLLDHAARVMELACEWNGRSSARAQSPGSPESNPANPPPGKKATQPTAPSNPKPQGRERAHRSALEKALAAYKPAPDRPVSPKKARRSGLDLALDLFKTKPIAPKAQPKKRSRSPKAKKPKGGSGKKGRKSDAGLPSMVTGRIGSQGGPASPLVVAGERERVWEGAAAWERAMGRFSPKKRSRSLPRAKSRG